MSSRPGPVLRRVLRAPGRLYDWRLGWLLGNRFLRLTHRGRRSGRLYRTMLEVLLHDGPADEFVVMAGLGHRADWLRNVRAGGAVEVAVGRRVFRPQCRELDTDEAAEALLKYESAHPLLAPAVRRVLTRLSGIAYDGSETSRRALVEAVPIVGLSPEPDHDHHQSDDSSVPGTR